MNEFEEKLNAILSDPGEMEKISRLAAQLMGGGAPDSAQSQPQTGDQDGALLGRLAGLMGGAGARDKTALLQALSPYLRPERQAKLKKALNIARVARLARLTLEEYGGGSDV